MDNNITRESSALNVMAAESMNCARSSEMQQTKPTTSTDQPTQAPSRIGGNIDIATPPSRRQSECQAYPDTNASTVDNHFQASGSTEILPGTHTYELLGPSNQPTSLPAPDTWSLPLEMTLDGSCTGYVDFLKGLVIEPQEEQSTLIPTQHAPFEPYDMWEIFTSSTYDWDLNPESEGIPDIGVLDQQVRVLSEQPLFDTRQELQALTTGVNAFKSSPWNWEPSAEDSGPAEETHFMLTDSDQARVRSFPVVNISRRLAATSSRDQVLALLIKFCEKKNIPKVVRCFSSSNLVEGLLSVAMQHLSNEPHGSVHVPLLDPNTITPEMLAGLMAYGASLTPFPAIQRLGYAIPELLRRAIVQKWEEDNSQTRNMDHLQVFTLTNALFFWSGNKRKMEIGEAFTQPVVTILRRSGMMRSDNFVDIRPSQSETRAELQQTWRKWVEQEAKIRFIHQVFIHDSQVSMTHFINPLLSCDEMLVPLPMPVAVWRASSAEEWKRCMLAGSGATRPARSLAHLIKSVLNQDFRHLNEEFGEASSLVFYGLWRFARSLQSFQSAFENDGLLDCMTGSFGSSDTGKLAHLQLPSSIDGRPPHALSLIRSYLSMALSAPLELIQTFVGKHGEAEAARVYPSLQTWAVTRNARLSIWRAAQALRSAEQMAPDTMRDFNAVVTYHAGLVLFVYGVLISAQQRKMGQTQKIEQNPQALAQRVWLSRESFKDIHNFVNTGLGLPVVEGLLSPAGVSSVHSVMVPGSVLGYTAQILRKQGQTGEGALSPFVEKMTQLLSALAQASSIAGYS
jgi:hypothetical protein